MHARPGAEVAPKLVEVPVDEAIFTAPGALPSGTGGPIDKSPATQPNK
jgi:hypothetical protein